MKNLIFKNLKWLLVPLVLLTLGVGNAWGGQYVYDFSSNANWYTGSTGNTHPTNGTDYTSFYDNRNPRVQWTLSSSNDRSRFNSGYFILGKTNKYINLPTYANEKITSVVVHSSSGGSTAVSVNVYTTGGTAAATNQTWSTQSHDYTYTIGENYQSSALRIQVTNNNRAQFTSVTINTAAAATKLGSINGSINMSSSTDGTVTISGWSDVSNASSYTVKLYKWNGSAWALANNNSTTGGSSGSQATRTGIATNSKSVTYSGLDYGATYKFTVQAIGNGSTYTNGDETGVSSINGNSLTSNQFLNKYSIYIDDATDANYAHNYINSLSSHAGSVDITLEANKDYYQYQLTLGGVVWWGNTGKMTSANCTSWTFTAGANNCKLQSNMGGSYTFALAAGTPAISVTYPPDDQSSGYKIYFDNSILSWSSRYYRIGNGSHAQNTALTLVTGTDNFYSVTTPSYDNLSAWHIANNTGWSGSDNNSIYKTKTGDGYAITNSIAFQQYVVTGDITIIPTTTHSTGGDSQNNNCEFYTINTPTSGMLTHTATITTPSHGTIHLAYTDVSGTAQDKTSTTSSLAHRTKITASATPADHYHLTAFTVTPSGGVATALTSGATDNHILAKDATFAATFAGDEYTITYYDGDATLTNKTFSGTQTSAPTTHTYGTATTLKIPTKTGYNFGGWYTSSTCTTGAVGNSTAASLAADGYTANISLYAKWTLHDYTISATLNNCTSSPSIPTSYTYTGSAANDEYTLTANSGYGLPSSITVSGTTYTWNQSTGKLVLTGTITSDVTITVTAQPKVTWMAGDAVFSTQQGISGTALSNPGTPASGTYCDGVKTFVGWSASEIDGTTNTPPGDMFLGVGGMTIPAGGATYHAVFATVPATEKYEKITSTGDFTPGYYVFATPTNAMTNTVSSKVAGSTSISITSGSPDYLSSSPSAAIIWFVTKNTPESTTYYTLYNSNVSKYMNIIADGNYGQLALENSPATYTATFDATEKDIRLYSVSRSGQLIEYYNGFKSYNSTGNAYIYAYKRNLTNYATTCGACETTATVGAASLKGTFSLSSVGVTCPTSGTEVGTSCTWLDYGFVWSPSSNTTPTIGGTNCTKVQTGTSGTSNTWDDDLESTFVVGNTYYYRAYGKNGKADADFVYGTVNSFTPRSVTLTGSGTVTGGTFTANSSYGASGMTITIEAEASSHFTFSSWTITKAGGGTVTPASATSASTTFTMPDDNVTITPTFTEDAYRTVVFKNNGSYLFNDGGSATTFDGTNKWKQKVYVGEAPVWPTALTDGTSNDACDDTSDKFYGWASNTWSGTLDDTDELDDWDGGTVYTSGPFANVAAGTGEIVYHAIWAQRSVSGSSFDITASDITQTSNSADETTFTKLSTDDFGYVHTIKNGNNDPSGWNQYQLIQIRGNNKGTGQIYNKTSITGLTKLRIVEHSNATALTVYYGTTSKSTSNSVTTPFASATGTQSVTYKINSSESTTTADLNYYDVNIPSGNGFFYLSNSSSGGSVWLSKITVYYSSYTYSNFLTTCCSDIITLSDPIITDAASSGSTVTYTESSPVATCSEAVTVHVTVSPASGYQATSITFGGTATHTGVSPTVSTPLNSEQEYEISYAKNTTAGTLAPSVTFAAKPLNSISLSAASGTVYVDQYVDFTVSYDPSDYLELGYTLTATPTYVTKVTQTPAYTLLRLKGGRSSGPGASITTTQTETVNIQASSDGTKTASVTMTVKPLPRVHFVDIVHGIVFDDVVATIEENALVKDQPTPTHDALSAPGSSNTCENTHLHLIGWIDSAWDGAADYLDNTTNTPPTTAAIKAAGSGVWIAAGADIDTDAKDGHTYYAVWAILE